MGLKELWILKFHRTWNTANRFAAAGVTADAWPRWLRHIEDH